MNNDFFRYLIGFIVIMLLWPLIKWLVLIVLALVVILILYLHRKIRIIKPSDSNTRINDQRIDSDDIIDVEYKTKDGE